MKRYLYLYLQTIFCLLLLSSMTATAFAAGTATSTNAAGKGKSTASKATTPFIKSTSTKVELTPRSILQSIKKDGARLTISRLRNEKTGAKTNYEWVILKVESGELIWLQIADALLPGLEPSFQQTMFVSGAKAMAKHPENAVRLLKGYRWPLEYLCDAPFQELSREGWEAHLLNIQSGLQHFDHPSFQREKDLCLRYIDWALERYPEPMPKNLKVGWSIPQELP